MAIDGFDFGKWWYCLLNFMAWMALPSMESAVLRSGILLRRVVFEFWELNLDPLKEQMLLNTEPSLQSAQGSSIKWHSIHIYILCILLTGFPVGKGPLTCNPVPIPRLLKLPITWKNAGRFHTDISLQWIRLSARFLFLNSEQWNHRCGLLSVYLAFVLQY